MPENKQQARPRTVRSFVRRAGRMTASQQKAMQELWPASGIEFCEHALDMAKVFHRDAPLLVEIGFGNGDSLVQQAAEHPEWNVIGIEVHTPGVGHCLLAANDAGLTNLRLIDHDAIDVLRHMIAPASIARLNLYFADPWPKKRHHKRRIVQAGFLQLVADRLAPQGRLHIATDWANYAEHIDETFAASDLFVCVERREHDGDAPLDRPATKFERRGLKRGHRIVDWVFARA
jgi:tRNA (guanine-N7-)-methyltransferase